MATRKTTKVSATPKQPTAAEMRSWYDQHKTTIENFDNAKSVYDKALIEYTNLTGITFNMTDETDTLINETETSKEKGLFSKFFGGKKK